MSRTSINPRCPHCRVRHDALKITRCRELAEEDADAYDDAARIARADQIGGAS